MDKKVFQKINEDGWNNLVRGGKPYSNTSLPEYGPFMKNENDLHILSNISEKIFLELGCSEGRSLEYLKDNGAKEVWGLDISEEQIDKAKLNPKLDTNKLFVSPMENNPGLPLNYFDGVLSLYSIGFCSDMKATINLVSQYLKKDGLFIMVWTHPLFNCLDLNDNQVILKKSYNDEQAETIFKGADKVETIQYNLKISTLVNTIIEEGLVIDHIYEEEPIIENHIGSYASSYWDPKKLGVSPTTLIIKAHKI